MQEEVITSEELRKLSKFNLIFISTIYYNHRKRRV